VHAAAGIFFYIFEKKVVDIFIERVIVDHWKIILGVQFFFFFAN